MNTWYGRLAALSAVCIIVLAPSASLGRGQRLARLPGARAWGCRFVADWRPAPTYCELKVKSRPPNHTLHLRLRTTPPAMACGRGGGPPAAHVRKPHQLTNGADDRQANQPTTQLARVIASAATTVAVAATAAATTATKPPSFTGARH